MLPRLGYAPLLKGASDSGDTRAAAFSSAKVACGFRAAVQLVEGLFDLSVLVVFRSLIMILFTSWPALGRLEVRLWTIHCLLTWQDRG